MSLPISLSEWITLRKHLPDSKKDGKFDTCCHLIIFALLTLWHQVSTIHLQFQDSYSYNRIYAAKFAARESCLHLLRVAWAYAFSMPQDYGSQISIEFAKSNTSFLEPYRGTSEVLDMAVVVNDNKNEDIPRVVFEVGVSESYIKAPKTKCKIVGRGRGRSHRMHYYQDSRDTAVPLTVGRQYRFSSPLSVKQSDFKSENGFGPVMYRDLRWTGTITTAFAESWTLNPLTKLATTSGKRTLRYYFYI